MRRLNRILMLAILVLVLLSSSIVYAEESLFSVQEVVNSYASELNTRFESLKKTGFQSDDFMLSLILKKDDYNVNDFEKHYAYIDGAWRTNLTFFQTIYGTEDISAGMVNNHYELSNETKKIMLSLEDDVKTYALATKELFFNRYVILKQGLINIYEKDWALEIEPNHDFNADIFYFVANPEHNPSKEPVWTPAYYDSIWDYWMISLITPIYDENDEFLGITGGDVILNDIYTSIQSKTYGGKGYSFLFDSDKNILVHPDYLVQLEKKGSMGEFLSFSDIGETGLSNSIFEINDEKGMKKFTEDGVEKLLFYDKIKDVNWYYGFVIETSLAIEETKTESIDSFVYAKESIKQKSIDVAKQIEIYIKSNPQMTVEDLQNDAYFQEIAVQQVGKTGYTAITDYDSLVCRFHSNPAIVDLDLHALSEQLPGFWRVMSRTEGGVVSEGLYAWEEADGSITQKYMYIAIVDAKTADGVGLSVAATTYLDEYEETIVQDLEVPIQDTLQKALLTKVQRAKTLFYNLEEEHTNLLKNLLSDFMEQDDYKKIFLENDREKLYNYSIELFNKNKEEHAVTHFYYEKLDGKVFLRVHNKVLFGDEINRITSKQSKDSNSWGTGIELGATAFALRVVHPYIYNDEQIGYVEFGMEIDRFIDSMKTQTGIDYGVIVKKEFIDENLWASTRESHNLRNNYDDFEEYVFIDSTDDNNLIFDSMDFHEEHLDEISDEGEILHEFKIGGKTYISGGFALYDAENNKVGAVVAAQDITQFKIEPTEKETNQTSFWYLIIGAIIIIIIIIIILFILNKLGIIKFEKTAILFLLTIIFLLVIGLFIFNTIQTSQTMKNDNIESVVHHLHSLANTRINFVEHYLEEQKDKLKIASTHNDFTNEELKEISEINREFDEIFVLNSDGVVIASSDELMIGLNNSNKDYFINFENEIYVTLIHFCETFEKEHFVISMPFREGLLVAHINIMPLIEIFLDTAHLSETGESLLVYRDGNGDAKIFSQRRFEEPNRINNIISKENLESPFTQALLKNEEVYLDFKDYRNVPVIAITGYFDELGVGVVTKVDKEESMAPILKSINKIWLFTVGIIFAIIVLGIVFNFLLTKTLRKEVGDKTKELKSMNMGLENLVKERTKELEKSQAELKKHEEELQTLVARKTKELNKKVQELEDTRVAVLNMLEDSYLSKEEIEKSHDDLMVLNKDMEKANKELTKMDTYKNEFLSISAHELKTPLASIHGFASLLQTTSIAENVKQREYYLRIIMEDADRLKGLIDDILDLSRLDVGTMKFFFEKVNIKELFKSIVKETYLLAREKGLVLKADVDNDIPIISTDKSRLSQVLINFINNAIKYSPKKGSKIYLSAKKQDDNIVFAVKDEGTGVAKKNINKIFVRFFQADSSYTRKVGGTGLGLAISKGIAEALGGTIGVKSKIGKGSTFMFTIPITKKKKGKKEIKLFKND